MKNRITNIWKTHRALVVFGFFVLLFVAGVVQYAFGLRYILPLTTLMLAMLASGAVYFWDATPKQKLIALIAILLGGFVLELIGVHTGLLFGQYRYGDMLGVKLLDVPLMIGVTWFLVTISAWQIASLRPVALWARFVLAGVLVSMLDLVLEQYAVTYGLWSWAGGEVPLYNYVCWFFVGMAMSWIYYRLMPKMQPSPYIVGILPLMGIYFWVMLLLA